MSFEETKFSLRFAPNEFSSGIHPMEKKKDISGNFAIEKKALPPKIIKGFLLVLLEELPLLSYLQRQLPEPGLHLNIL